MADVKKRVSKNKGFSPFVLIFMIPDGGALVTAESSTKDKSPFSTTRTGSGGRRNGKKGFSNLKIGARFVQQNLDQQ